VQNDVVEKSGYDFVDLLDIDTHSSGLIPQ
jgi:hypothetical protein